VPSSLDAWFGSAKSMAAECVGGGEQGNRWAKRRRRPVAQCNPTAGCAPVCDDTVGKSVSSRVRMSRPERASGYDFRIRRGCVLEIVLQYLAALIATGIPAQTGWGNDLLANLATHMPMSSIKLFYG
jgi:hypothetical protein